MDSRTCSVSAHSADRTLQRFLHKLAGTLDPVPIATALYAQEIIGERTWEEARSGAANYDRNLQVLGALIKGVKANPGFFDKFCTILEEQEVTRQLSRELKAAHEVDQNSPTPMPNGVDQIQQPIIRPSKRKQCEDGSGTLKQRVIIKEGKIDNDKFLMDIAHEIGGKWEEVGIALGVDFKVLRSVVGSETGKPDHMRAFYMLQEWKNRAAENYTYKFLAAALEGGGLNTCAQQYCYSSCTNREC